MRALSKSEADKIWNQLTEDFKQNKNVKMIRDSWQGGFTVQLSNEKYKVTRTVQGNDVGVAEIVGTEF